MADKIYIDNDKLSLFHGFSKTPVSSKIALGNAINKSGHTVQSSEIWSDEIPYFGKFGTTQVAHDTVSKDTVYGDMLYIGGNSYYKRNDVEYAEGKTFNELWTNVTADFKDGYVFENRHGKGVIVYHQNQYLQNLNDDNNANTNSENCAARLWVYETKEGETKKVARLVEQFVGPTDKALNGLASVSYSPVVKPVGGEAYEEGTQYSLVGFSGTVLWSEDRANKVTTQSDGSVTSQFQISCFEYIGDKLDATLTDIDEKISKVVGEAFEGAVASVTASTATQNLGLTVSEGANPEITVTPGTISEAKLVTGSTVKTYVDTTALAEGGSIAEYVEDYVATNAKVSVNGQSATTITVKGTEASAADLVKVVVTEDKTTENKIGLTLTATLDAAVIDDNGNIDKDGVVIATIAKDIAESVADTAITNAITTDKGAIKDAITKAISDATLADGQKIATTTDTSKLVTVEDVTTYVSENAKVTLTQGTGITVTPSGQASTSFTVAVDDTIATKKSVEDLSALVTGVSQTVAGIQTELSTDIATGISEAKAAAKAAQDTADAKVASVTGGNSLVSVSGGTNVTITVSDTIATKSDITTEIDKLSDADGVITTLTTRVNEAEASASASETAAKNAEAAAKSAQSAAEGAKSEAAASKTAAEAAQSAAEASKTAAESSASNASASAEAAEGSAAAASNSETAAKAAQSAAQSAQTAAETAAADAKAAKDFVEATAEWQAGSDEELGNFTTATASGVVIGTTVKTVADEVLALAKSYADSKHTTSLDYVVLADNETLPTASAETLGKIYLVKEGNTANGETAIDAISGSYVEYMTRKIGDGTSATYAWEKIGTTAADLSAYAKNSDIAGINDTIAALDANESVNGITVTQVDGKITGLTEALIIASVPEDTTKVVGNIAYVGSTKHVIAPEKFETAAQMPATLTSWVADLSNLTNGDEMFKGCAGLTVFVGDLSSLTSAVDMFNGCTLDEDSLEILSENLPTVTSGIIDIGASTKATAEMIATIKGKGWTVKSNGTAL